MMKIKKMVDTMEEKKLSDKEGEFWKILNVVVLYAQQKQWTEFRKKTLLCVNDWISHSLTLPKSIIIDYDALYTQYYAIIWILERLDA